MAAIEGVSSRRTLEVIAEGVETEAMRALLEQNGCHAYQGLPVRAAGGGGGV